MSTIGWNQWSYSELMSMHGVEDEDCDIEECHDDYDAEPRQQRGCECSNCMDCLGLSWRDFF